MKKIFGTSIVLLFTLLLFSCKQEEVVSLDNPNVASVNMDTTLKSYYPKPTPSSTFESLFGYNFPNVNCQFSINMSWYDPESSHGIYAHFNNSVGDFLIDDAGFIKTFNSGVKIDSTLAGNWSGNVDGRISYDYILNPSANKGNLAGQGDKYIIFRAFSEMIPTLKYYGYVRIRVSENGRDVKVISLAYQQNPNTSFITGEY